MKAVVFEGREKVAVQSFPDPELGTKESVIVQVEKTSICGSDLHPYREDGGISSVGLRPGHEFIGTIVDAGSGVTRFKKEDRVIVSPVFGCGACRHCRSGEVFACDDQWQNFGTAQGPPGGQAEYAEVPKADLFLRWTSHPAIPWR
jgi:threonine dehydrogenase-like Zn-dependent dehydrogenase